jgi:coenzyme F420-0:L-glutamate ligase/coenzyme F420-1:gamma-L-glutamate ligase
MRLDRDAAQAFLTGRRSVRRFRPDSVAPELIDRVLQVACRAPSAHNRQPWRFVVLPPGPARGDIAAALAREFQRDLAADGLPAAEVEARVRRAVDRLTSAPAAVLLCMTMDGMDRYPDPRRHQAERDMAMQSAALAGGQLLLAAHAEGLGACWMCAPLFAPQVVRQCLDLPEVWEPQALILLGRPACETPETPRLPQDETVIWR